mmetsp:Transcript_48843/g.66506  ORF Transcript_48843/g.66506 Transcript_48843/m.66506 type:complete len:318 (-) Transcript_48843:69-1022(-)
MNTSDLDVVLVSNALELGHILRKLGESDMYGSSEGGTKVGGARGDVTKVLVVGELGNLLNSLGGTGESIEDSTNIGTVLHGDDSKLILLINPDKEGLVIVVEDTSAGRPVSVEVAGLKETVAFLEEEVVVDKLLLGSFIHTFKRVESTLEVTLEVLASLNNGVHDLKSLLFGDTRSERESSKVSANSNSGGFDHLGVFLTERRGNEVSRVHVGNVLGSGSVTVVVLNNLIEELVELRVSFVGTSVNTNTRVKVLDTGEDAGLESDTVLILLVLVFFPDILREALAKLRFAVSGEGREFSNRIGTRFGSGRLGVLSIL